MELLISVIVVHVTLSKLDLEWAIREDPSSVGVEQGTQVVQSARC